MKTKHLIFAVAFILTALLFVGCTARARDPNTFIIATQGGPRSLDPTLTNDSASSEIMVQVYDTLFNLDFDTLEPIPSLAESYAFEYDAFGNLTLLRIFLRRGILFHNHDELTAADIKFSLDRAMVSPHISHIAGEIIGTEIINDHEVLVSLSAPFVPILNNLAHTALSIVNKRAVTEMGDAFGQHPIGTGALKFVNWVRGSRIELTRWDYYWGETPRIENVIVRYINDAETMLLELETGGVDLILNVSPQNIARVESNPNLQMLRRRDLAVSYIGFNMQRPPFDDLRVRQAVAYAINIDDIVDNVGSGFGIRARGPLSSVVWASAADILPHQEYNPDRARQLLAEAGFPNGFTVGIYTNETQGRIDIAQIAQNMLARVGITLEISILEWAAYLDMLDRGDQQMFILGWVTVTGDPDYGLEIFHTRSFGQGGNNARFSNVEVDRLLDAARRETNPALRYEMYIEAQRLIHAEVPMIYLTEGETRIAARANVRGFQINPAGHHPFWTVWLDDGLDEELYN